jgi:hypothetical protein
MSVDMFVTRFRQELSKLAAFKYLGQRDDRIQKANLPPGRAAFTAACLAKHTEQYQLPTYEYFSRIYTTTVGRRRDFQEKFSWLFETRAEGLEPKPGLIHRLSQWYESGIAEEYLYTCLAEALEDRAKVGVVTYDARVDWKFKADLILLCSGHVIRVDSHRETSAGRAAVVAERELAERQTKRNTLVSSHWGNEEYSRWPVLTAVRHHGDCEMFNGFMLYSGDQVDSVLRGVYELCAVPQQRRFFMSEMMKRRPR